MYGPLFLICRVHTVQGTPPPTYILYMLELSLKRLDILLDCSKDQRQDIAPWLDCPEIYAHMLSTGNRGVVLRIRGCLLTPGRLSFPTSV